VLTTTALGGLAPWSRWQFIGAFGVIEAASGLANVISPNVWRLPVAELQTSERTDVKLARSALLLPHWGGLARCVAGLVCLAVAAWQEGLSPASAGLLPLLLVLAWSILAISAALARAGVFRPDLDVVQLVVRWGRQEKEIPPLSISAAAFQFLLSIATIPAVKLLPPAVLYQPELGPFGRASGAGLFPLVRPHRVERAAGAAARSRGARVKGGWKRVSRSRRRSFGGHRSAVRPRRP
jgi:hypothetical protein